MANVQPIFIYHASDWTTFKFLRFRYESVTYVISKDGLGIGVGDAPYVPCTVTAYENRFRIVWDGGTMDIGFLKGNRNASDATFPSVSKEEATTTFRNFLGLQEDGTAALPSVVGSVGSADGASNLRMLRKLRLN